MSAIDDKYSWLLANVVDLGAPLGAESACADGMGRVRRYEYGTIYSFPPVGAFEVHGAIAAHYGREPGTFPEHASTIDHLVGAALG